MSSSDDYGLSPAKPPAAIDPPVIDYRPPMPRNRDRTIALIGAGGICGSHLQAYRDAGLNVVAIVDRTLSKAEAVRDRYFPNAEAIADYRVLLIRDDVEVFDVTPHPADRLPILEDAIVAGKHLLSQKPLVLDLDDGARLVALAEQHRVRLAVNQNGRWAPHFRYIDQAVRSGLIGDVVSIDFSLQWDQTWIAGIEALERIKHLILFDFGIHWFDITTCWMAAQKPTQVWAATTQRVDQKFRPDALASVVIQYPTAQVRMSFNGHVTRGELDSTTIVGTRGTLRSQGPGLNHQPYIEGFLDAGSYRVPLEGCWFKEGFQGSMGELLSAIEDDRLPEHNARENLDSLALCFAAVQSAETGEAVTIGSVRQLPNGEG
ncbi:Inositol 2-dehydrogenase [Rosistilla carotiformis]|uniref:Inositol 2-dehydrogenase n=1 Tax=Rosistilla carotiformis TaxID=2528017 RepID=A0A518JWL3_9BACT|nr:Gfo/Idh/MocA family oxidoreductase [Rosistilla carotiformis]QDV69923.1 Inositol 2-dehydrogenase [Rosistilla carotiformis]